MPKCRKGFTLVTKVCSVECTQCPDWDTRNKRQVSKDESIAFLKGKAVDKLNYRPRTCAECKYYDGGTCGYNSVCTYDYSLKFGTTFYNECISCHPKCPLKEVL